MSGLENLIEQYYKVSSDINELKHKINSEKLTMERDKILLRTSTEYISYDESVRDDVIFVEQLYDRKINVLDEEKHLNQLLLDQRVIVFNIKEYLSNLRSDF